MKSLTLLTSDNLQIAGSYWDVKAEKSALLLHAMPANKESWKPLAEKLYSAGVNVFAIDFRGHGDSSGGDYLTFTNEQHQEYYKDVEAAAQLLKQTYPTASLSIVGASIGANMALKYGASHHDIVNIVALSAGYDYYGVRALDFVSRLSESQRVLFIGSADDVGSSGLDCAKMAEGLYDHAASQKQKITYQTGGHGTHIIENHPELIDQITTFILKI